MQIHFIYLKKSKAEISFRLKCLFERDNGNSGRPMKNLRIAVGDHQVLFILLSAQFWQHIISTKR